jgi:hypothetical protein
MGNISAPRYRSRISYKRIGFLIREGREENNRLDNKRIGMEIGGFDLNFDENLVRPFQFFNNSVSAFPISLEIIASFFPFTDEEIG